MPTIKNSPANETLNPVLLIWLKPKKTFAYLIKRKIGIEVLIFPLISSLIYLFFRKSRIQSSSLYTFPEPFFSVHPITEFLIFLVLDTIYSFITTFVLSCLYFIVAKIFKGKGSLREFWVVNNWCSLPVLVLGLPMMLWFQFGIYDLPRPIEPPFIFDLYIRFLLIWLLYQIMLLGFLSMAYLIIGIALVSQFRIRQAIFTILIAGAAVIIFSIISLFFPILNFRLLLEMLF